MQPEQDCEQGREDAQFDDLKRYADTAFRIGPAHTVHGTEPCTDPQCTTEREHGHSCPRCGPGTYMIVDIDD
jgi:hypothetical protein